MSFDVAILATNLSKAYRTYRQPSDRLKQALYNGVQPFFRAFGKTGPEQRYYSEQWALHPINLEIKRGETVAIIGKNGSGKSTLLSLLCGTSSATSGEVRHFGRVGALLELGSGFNPEFTGRENVYLNASLLGLSTVETEARIHEIASFADIGDYFDQPIKTYSSGMTMRLAFSVIAHVDCDILVIDEALAVGDAYFQQKCLRWLRQFQKTGTVVFVSHDVGAVLSLCSRAVWLNEGKTQMIGVSKDVCEAYTAFIHKMITGQKLESPNSVPSQYPPDESSQLGPSSPDSSPPSSDTAAAGTVMPAPLPQPPQSQSAVFDTLANSDSFGTGMAKIISGNLVSPNDAELPMLQGGEIVKLVIKVQALKALLSVIVGFIVKDRLGQPIFGDNTLERNSGQAFDLSELDTTTVTFEFQMPLLATGRYAITLAVATGTLAEHIQHHWLHDALMFDIHSSVGGVVFGLPSSRSTILINDNQSLS